jgi:hypothetical protein
MHHQQSGSELDKSKRISFSISNILETKSEEEEEELEEEEEDSEEDEEEEEERRNSSQQLGYLAAISTAAATAVSSSSSSFSSASSAAYLAHLRHRHCTENNRIFYFPRIGPHISFSRIGRSMVGIYNLFTDT